MRRRLKKFSRSRNLGISIHRTENEMINTTRYFGLHRTPYLRTISLTGIHSYGILYDILVPVFDEYLLNLQREKIGTPAYVSMVAIMARSSTSLSYSVLNFEYTANCGRVQILNELAR